MPEKFIISPRVLSDPFWDVVLGYGEGRELERQALLARLGGLEALRAQASYNTGSIALTAGWCLYSLVRHFRVRRLIEVGTFIGKSTVSMASAMDDEGAPGEIVTCDGSNAIDLPWDGQTRITQFKSTTSTDMLKTLDGVFDSAFLDGRITQEDLSLLDQLLAPDAIIALDDFEGMEKGVVNLSLLRALPKFRNHFLIYPPTVRLLEKHGLTSYSLTAVLLPMSLLHFARQG